MLFNEPKLLKFHETVVQMLARVRFSALQRAEIAEIGEVAVRVDVVERVSVLFNEPKLLKFGHSGYRLDANPDVSVLFNEPKLLK